MRFDINTRIKNYLEIKLNKLLNLDSKTKIIYTNLIFSSIIKVSNVAITFLTVPILINYLNPSQYGIWLTILTFTSWFIIFDLGFGNGLKNKLVEFNEVNDVVKAKKYISTTFLSMLIIVVILISFFSFLVPVIPWTHIYNFKEKSNNDFPTATLIMLIYTLLCMLLRLINNLLYADQKSYKVDVINLIFQSIGFLGLIIIKEFYKPSLTIVALGFSISQILILIIINIYLFKYNYKLLVPRFSFFDFTLISQITTLGGRFFFLQISGLVMYMTDNFIIANLFGSKEVTVYNISLKYFTLLLTAWSMVLIPLWPMTTKAFYSNDNNWLNKLIKKLIKLWLVTIVLGIIMLLISNYFYNFWIHSLIKIPQIVNLFILLYIIVSIFATIIATFINGIGKIKLQVYITGFMAIINIPLAIFFSKTLSWGLIGVPLATTICLAISSIFGFIQYKKIIDNKAIGIWND